MNTISITDSRLYGDDDNVKQAKPVVIAANFKNGSLLSRPRDCLGFLGCLRHPTRYSYA